MFAFSLTDEQALEIATIYPKWMSGKVYSKGELVTYGENTVGDPQLYRVVASHTSQSDWTPDVASSLFTSIGLNNSGYVVWSQPTGAHDAYNMGDIVEYNGTLYKSIMDGNVYSPDVYPSGWEVFKQ